MSHKTTPYTLVHEFSLWPHTGFWLARQQPLTTLRARGRGAFSQLASRIMNTHLTGDLSTMSRSIVNGWWSLLVSFLPVPGKKYCFNKVGWSLCHFYTLDRQILVSKWGFGKDKIRNSEGGVEDPSRFPKLGMGFSPYPSVADAGITNYLFAYSIINHQSS